MAASTVPAALRLDGRGAATDQAPGHGSDAAASGPVWVHVRGADPAEARWLSEESGVEPLVARILLQEDTRPRATPRDDGLILMLRGVNTAPGELPEDMVSLRIWAEAGRLISVTLRPLHAEEEVTAALKRGAGPKDISGVLLALIERVVDGMRAVAAVMDDTLDQLEDDFLDESTPVPYARLKEVRRRAIWLKRFAAPQAEALRTLLAAPPTWLDKAQRRDLHETANAMTRTAETIELLREHAMLLHDQLDALLQEKSRRITYLLTVVASIFLPLNLLAALMGANVGGVPWADNPVGFWILCGIAAVLGLIGLALFRWLK